MNLLIILKEKINSVILKIIYTVKDRKKKLFTILFNLLKFKLSNVRQK
jgi:hypothetical protein